MTIATRTLLPLAAALALALAMLAGAVPASGHEPVATAASTKCAKHGNHGFTYLYPFYVKGGASCHGGRVVIGGYRGCLNHGHSVCTTHRYSCHRTITDHSPVQYDAKVSCTRGNKKVAFHYTQNL